MNRFLNQQVAYLLLVAITPFISIQAVSAQQFCHPQCGECMESAPGHGEKFCIDAACQPRTESCIPSGTFISLRALYKFLGSGRVTSSPPGIDCGENTFNCTGHFSHNSPITLTATPAEKWVFAGWDGDNGACTGTNPTTRVNVPTNARTLTCVAKFNPVPQQTFDRVTEFVATALLLLGKQDIDLGSAISRDTPTATLSHFQRFREGQVANSLLTSYNSFFSSAEMHRDGCIYVAYTPARSPYWYDITMAEDTSIGKGQQVRLGFSDRRTLGDLEGQNISEQDWADSFIRYDWDREGNPGPKGSPGGPFPLSYGPTPRWFKLCVPPGSRPVDWTDQIIKQIPSKTTPSVKKSGAFCNWKVANFFSLGGFGPPEFKQLLPFRKINTIHLSGNQTININFGWPSDTVEGIITNSYLSGEDYTGDHARAPDGYNWDGPVPKHNGNCEGAGGTVSGLVTAIGQLCNDWEINVRPNPEYRFLLAPTDVAPEACPDPACGKGNYGDEFKGNLGLEIEQWLIPVGFRPQPGDRTYITGRRIVDCGHDDWHTELHPMELIISSRVITPTRVNQYAVTNVVVTGAWQGGDTEFDIWPPARPTASAVLRWHREIGHVEGLQVQSEEAMPKDNPNHIHVRIRAPEGDREVLGWGDVSYDPRIRLAIRYFLSWEEPVIPPPPPTSQPSN